MMRAWGLATGAVLLGGGGAWVAGAFDSGEFYPMAPAAVEARLAGLQFGSEAGPVSADAIRLALRSRGPTLLRWELMAAGKPIGEARARLAPEDGGTRVAVEFAFTRQAQFDGLEKDPFIIEVAQIAMEEKIDSVLDGRAFDMRRVETGLALAVAADPEAPKRLSRLVEESGARKHESWENDSAAIAEARRNDPRFYGQPTMSAKPAPPPDFSETHEDGGWGKK